MPSLPRALALALLAGAAPVHAQSADPAKAATNLQGVGVVGDWLGDASARDVQDHPGARTAIHREQIIEAAPMQVRDMLRRVPGVQVQESNGTGGSDISLNVGVRGLASRLSPRSIILLDGVPMEVAPYGQPQVSMMPMAVGNLEAIDVVRGGGSVRYGPQNVGGIINFVTRPIPETFGGSAGLTLQGDAHGGIQTQSNAFLGGTTAGGLGVALLYSGLKGPGFREHENNTSIDDVMLKTQYKFSDTDTLSGSLHYYSGHAGMPGGLDQADFDANPFQSRRPFDDFAGRRKDAVLKYSHVDDSRSFELLSYYTDSFRGSHLEQVSQSASTGLYTHQLMAAPRNYHVFAIEPRYSQRFDGAWWSQEISLGYRYLNEAMHEQSLTSNRYVSSIYYTPFDQNPYGPLVRTGNSTGGTEANALYVDDAITLGRWTITPGLRYERIDTRWEAHPDATVIVKGPDFRRKKYSQPLPSLNLIYSLSEQWKLYANAETSFGSLQYFQISQKDSSNQFAAGLKPEKAHTYELGTRYDNGRWGAEATVFRINFDDELQYVGHVANDLDSHDTWTNLGATTHKGLETAAHYDFGSALPGLSLWGTFTYTQATYDFGSFAGKDLPFYSRRTMNLGLRYAHAPWVFNLDAFAQSRQHSPGSPTFPPAKPSPYVRQGSADGELGDIPGWASWNLRTEYDFGPSLAYLKLAAGVKNLLDRRYYTRSTDNNGGLYVGQPRTFFVQAAVDF